MSRWYTKWWVWIIAILIVYIIYISIKESTAYFNYVKLIELERTELLKRSAQQDSIIKIKEKEIKAVKLQLSKLNTNNETYKIRLLQAEIDALRKRRIVKDTLPPEELNIYLQKLLK